jgi:predicted exporter
VVVGGIIGIAMAYALYMFTNEKIKGKIKEKPDDDGPI